MSSTLYSSPKRDQPPADLGFFHPVVSQWFNEVFAEPTHAQRSAWPAIAAGQNTLLLAPTGSGKTLAAFLVAIDRIMFAARDRAGASGSQQPLKGVRTLYISPLKALGVDVERNLRAPIAGVRAVASREGIDHHEPTVGVRSGDTPASERHRMTRHPPEILITTPESLFLMLTSRAREMLTTIDTVIVDEIHTMVPTKRGAHLFLSLERLERLRQTNDPHSVPLQRIGLSATQRPLDEVARLLGGAEGTADPLKPPRLRPVTIVEAGRRKQLQLSIQVPVEDMAQLGQATTPSGPAAAGPTIPSIWPAIHPRLIELIRQHRSTMIFVNSRRLAERLASAVNELADEEMALAHHGSIAREQRLSIEDRLKRGDLPAIVATSSLELGIDMGAVDLVIQVESPPSIASGMQRIGRSGHQVGVPSKGVVFPKYRGDLLACTAAIERMVEGEVEETFYPRNPLDLLAQQMVAMVALEPMPVDDLYATARSSAPFFDLPRTSFEGVLDLLSGRYPSDEFAGLRPRLTWDRVQGQVAARKGAQRLAIANAGTIPDRGLYGVFLAGNETRGSRVGELDEEMVFETHPGDVFLLGASAWRVVEITHDRVLVVPAPGEPGRMPFWRGDGPGRPLEFGRAIGQLSRELAAMPREEALRKLKETHYLDRLAAVNLCNYIDDQKAATGELPTDQTIVIESFLDEIGDWRVVVMTPFGSRLHAPWATAVAARLRAETAGEVDMMWCDDGMVFRLPESPEPPRAEAFFPSADEVEQIIVRELGSTALFAAHFRENAARALLLPRRQPGKRAPLWLQRRRAADLLNVAARYERFPIMLETFRECLRDVFDVPGLRRVLQEVQRRTLRVCEVTTQTPSPFAASLLFNYTGNFLYNGDAPLAERRAATLTLDHAQLRELLGDAQLRELLEPEVVEEVAIELQRLDAKYPIKHPDGIHDLLLSLGDLSRDELWLRCDQTKVDYRAFEEWIETLVKDRRLIGIRIAGEPRLAAAEDAGRFREALGVVPPLGLPEAFREAVDDPLTDLVSRYARTHIPFKPEDVAARFGIGVGPVNTALKQLETRDRVLQGEFVPGGRGREWCDAGVLRMLKRKSLARLRKQVEPVAPEALARLQIHWQALDRPRRGLDGLLDVIEQLQGAPLPASVLEREILAARVENYKPSDLDELCHAGEVVWRGIESIGPRDGRVALYLTDYAAALAPPPVESEDELELRLLEVLAERGASFFGDLARHIGGFSHDVLQGLWRLVWAGHVTNDTLAPLRATAGVQQKVSRGRRRQRRGFRSRRSVQLPGSEGRWTLFNVHTPLRPTVTERQTVLAQQLIERYGVVTRETVISEGVSGGFAALYPVFKAMEEAGRVRRGYFVAGQGAAQFAAPGAEDRLRDFREPADRRRSAETSESDCYVLATTDPANPYGASLPWPKTDDIEGARPQRSAGSRVILCDGQLLGYLTRSERHLRTFFPSDQAGSHRAIARLLESLVGLARGGSPVYLSEVDRQPVGASPLAGALKKAGFVESSKGFLLRA